MTLTTADVLLGNIRTTIAGVLRSGAGAHRILAEDVGTLDRLLSGGEVPLPLDWKPAIDPEADGHALVEELRAWCHRLAPRDIADLRALIDRVEEWMAQPVAELPPPFNRSLDLHAAFQAGMARGSYQAITDGASEWIADVPPSEERWVATALELGSVAEYASEQGVKADDGPQPGGERPRDVHLVVSYLNGQIRYFSVGEDGWRFDTRTRELVIGRGVPRTHVPLDTVSDYAIEDCP